MLLPRRLRRCSCSLLLPYCCQKPPVGQPEAFVFLAFCRYFCGALGRTRTCDLLIRSQTRSRTRGDRERHGETKPRFYHQLSTSKGTGRDRERHGVVVPLWYRTPLAYSIGGREQVDTAYEDHQILSPPCS